ncbi:MAG: LD-carboxypeptidase, partial [Bacteroidales bacterium]|nr:LD-carboxypeptidase [Bacteroidales bacterium]
MRVKSLFALAALAVLSGSLHSASAQMAPLRPDYLKPGDKVAVISPSYAPAQDDSTVFRACEVLRSWGLVPVEGQFVRQGKNLDKDLGVKGLPFVLRYEDFLWALRDDEIKAIIPSRGGYGGIHFVDRLDLADISAHPKWIVGYSDITNFHLAWYNAGVMSIHGNMCIDLCKQKGDEPSRNRLRDLLFGKVPIYNLPPEENNIPGKAEGILLGGNFITMEALF